MTVDMSKFQESGIGTLSGDWYPGRLTQAKTTFQDKDGPIGLQLGRAGQTYGRLLQGNQPYRMPAVGPGATGPPSSSTRRSSDWPAAGPRWSLGWPINQSNRPYQDHQSAQAQSAHLTTPGEV